MLKLGVLVAASIALPTQWSASADDSVMRGPAVLDEAHAMIEARRTGKPVEIGSLTTETTLVTANPGGTMTMTSTARPVRVRQNDEWVPVDTTLVFTKDGRVAPKAAAVATTFSGGDAGPMATIADKGRQIGLRWPGDLPPPTLTGNVATYAEVLPGVDLLLKSEAEGFDQVLVVKTRQAANNPQLANLRFTYEAQGLLVHAGRGDNIRVTDRAGNAVFGGPAPEMWDSSGMAVAAGPARSAAAFESGTGAKRALARATLKDGAIHLAPDRSLLTGKATKFPVYIDPTFKGSKYAWTFVSEPYPNQSYWNSSDIARVGWSTQENIRARSFFRLNTNGLGGKQIIKATMSAPLVYSWSCTPREVALWATNGISSATTWNNQPKWNYEMDRKNEAKGWSSSCPGGDVEFNAIRQVKDAAKYNWANVTMGLRAPNESDTYAWKKFGNNPILSVEYDSPPITPDGMKTSPGTPCVGGKIGNSDVTLEARPRDPDGGTVTAEFSFWKAGGATTTRSVNATSGNPARTVVSRTILTEGLWYWKVRTYSTGDYSAYTATCSFTIDKSTPIADIDVSSTAYPVYAEPDWQTSAVPAGTPGAFTLDAKGQTDVTGFYVGIDDSAPTYRVATNQPGGTATVTLLPFQSGPGSVYIQPVDSAGNRSVSIDSDHTFFATTPPDHAHNGDLNGDAKTDMLAIADDGRVCLYLSKGDSTGGFLGGDACAYKVDANRNGFKPFRAGRLDPDGYNDLLVVANGELKLHRGTGAGGYIAGGEPVYTDNDEPVTGWGIYNMAFSPGDWNGDQFPDVMTRDANGALWLHANDGYGRLMPRTQVGSGWGIFNRVFGAGDMDGDGDTDILARTTSGDLRLYQGNGAGGWQTGHGVTIGTSWNTYSDQLFSPGDWNGDGTADVMGVNAAGDMRAYYVNQTAPSYFSNAAGGTIIGRAWTLYDWVI
ncbi:FG-GAP-like repeat-containing protein [Actinokineospora guangxiensis]|uniref:FG-GAP-like repeat-containing protein n=1 Tax=Actinokineospora guangxiensis TaxID=1490288 RepID=A0ABW0EVR8_9PSEU